MIVTDAPIKNPPEKYALSLWVIASIPVLVTFLFYLPVLNNGFVNWDDPLMVLNNPYIRSLSLDSIRMMFTNFYAAYWIPLSWLSLAIDFNLGNLNPFVYHFHNLILHCLNTALVFFLGLRIFIYINESSASEDRKTGRVMPAVFLTALLFGLHPLHVESVAWATERKDVLCGFFFLASLMVYMDYASSSIQKAWKRYACLFLFMLALLSKPMATTLPLILLLLDGWPLKRFSTGFSKVFMEKIPFFIVSIISGCMTVLAHSRQGAIPAVDIMPLDYRVMNAFHSVIYYLVKIIAPTNLSPLYPILLWKALSIEYLALAFLVILISLACFFYRRNRPYLATAWLYYLITLAPVLGILQVGSQAAADRFTYLPCLGPLLLSASVVAVFLSNRRFIFIPMVVGLVAVLGFRTTGQINTWKDSISLGENIIKVISPYVSSDIYENLGDAYMMESRWENALQSFDSAITISPQKISLHGKKGLTLLKMNLPSEAAKEFEKEATLNPQNALVHRYLYMANQQMGVYETALKEAQEAVRLDPTLPGIFNSLGTAFFLMTQYEKAAAAFEKAHSLVPLNLECLTNLAAVYASTGQISEAIETLKAAAALQPQNPVIYQKLGQAYEKAGNKKMAVKAFLTSKSLMQK